MRHSAPTLTTKRFFQSVCAEMTSIIFQLNTKVNVFYFFALLYFITFTLGGVFFQIRLVILVKDAAFPPSLTSSEHLSDKHSGHILLF